MSSMKEVKLKTLAVKIGSGVTPRGGSDVFVDDGVLFIRSQNIRNGKVDISDKKYIPAHIDAQMISSRVKKGDVLYNITGASIGRSAVYELNVPANVNQHVCIVRLKDVNPQYINYVLSSSIGRRNLWSFQAGGNREGLNFQQLGSFKIPLPEKPEQVRIVGVLETWDEYLELLDKKIALKEQLRKGLMQQLLAGKKRLPGFTDEWRVVKYGNLCSFQSGFAFTSRHFSDNGGVRLIRNRDLKADESKIYYDASDYSPTYLVYDGDVLIGMDGDFMACRWQGGTSLLNQRVGRLVNFKNADPDFIFYHCQRELRAIENETSSTTVKHLSAKQFEDRTAKVPDYDEQCAISNVLRGIDSEIELLRQKKSSTERQKKYLLKNLIAGTIRVPERSAVKEAVYA